MTAPDSTNRAAPLARPSRYLVIANRTTDSDTLRAAG